MSTEAKELDLCGKVEMRIALAKDDKLESILKLYLAPLLLKLASEHKSVREKVISITSHIKIRLAGDQNVVLPVAALLKQYKENPESSLIRDYDLYFIQQSIGKLPSKEQTELVPAILAGLSKDSESPTSALMFNLFFRLLPKLKLPPRGSKEDLELREKLSLAQQPDDSKFLASWFGKLILLNFSRPALAGAGCPGLSTADYNFLTLNGKEEVWDSKSDKGLDLVQTKIDVLNFLSSGAFTDTERFESALFASGDSNSRVSDFGNDMLKRIKVPLEDPICVERLLDLYFKLTPALQTRILVLLTKSAVSTTFPSQIVRIMQMAIQPDDNTILPAKGLETNKFRNALFNYMNWVSRIGPKETLNSIAPQLVELLKNFIEDQGWPVPNERSSEASSLRALAYETLGSLAKTTPSIVLEKDLRLVRWLFRSLTEDGSAGSFFVCIEHALSSLLGIFTIPLEPDLTSELRHLLLNHMALPEDSATLRSARFTVVRWANHCLEYGDIVGRWIDILAIGDHADERSEVIEEGNKGLDPYWYYTLNPSAPRKKCLLDWNRVVNGFFSSESILECSATANSLKTGMTVDSVSVFGNFPAYRINAFGPAVAYCWKILLLDALSHSEIPFVLCEDWEQKINVLFHSDQQSRDVVRNHVKSLNPGSLDTYLNAAFEGFLWKDGSGLPNCAKCFVEFASVAPSEAIGRLSSRAFELLPSIRSNNTATRYFAAQAYGILVSHPNNSIERIETIIQALLAEISPWETAFGSEANRIHGYILALGFVLSRLSYHNQLRSVNSSLVDHSIAILLKALLATKDNSIHEAVLNAISQISAAEVLKIPHLNKLDVKASGVIEFLVAAAQKGDERSISTLGRLSLIFDNDSNAPLSSETYVSSILTSLYKLFELKQTEIQFTVGEAISCLAACWDSDVLKFGLDVETKYIGRLKRKDILESVLEKLLGDCKSVKPSLKKASGIWLFYLIQHCGHLEEIQSRLRECQAAFMELLSARDELVQETASRGLSLVYEQGDKSLRESLVKDLVSSFTGSGSKLKVDEDTELFEPGALPTGEGNSVTSYKDIISLANEVGDQSLIYKFMSLASNAATWSTRAAFGRFGLSSILSESDPKLYPKLYRYRFDPNPNVRRSMNDIWKALVKDSNATINLYFEEILYDLLQNILGKEWRTRQASCAALADLVQGREFEKYEKHLDEIWQAAFKVLDDIKGSVREAAQSLSVVLTNILVRQVETGTTSKHAQSMLKQVVPFLISEQGMESSAQDVRAFATVTIIRLIKSGGKALLPFIPDLVERLLGLLSTIEPEEINYVYQRAAEHRDKIDQIRSNAVSRSPLMEAIERCLDLLDEPTMKALASRLEASIKTMIGVPSKIGCAGLLVTLATRNSFIFRPYADTFLKTVEKTVLDRNNTVSVAFAGSTGHLSRLASDKALSRLASYTQNLYFSNGINERSRQISGEIVYAVAKFATDRFNSMALDFLPFVFFASHDPDGEVRQQFQATWDENVAGSRTVTLYANEIIQLSLNHFESPMWSIKHTAALTIADVVESVQLETSGSNATNLWPALEKALLLKTFDGKEKVLEAFIKFVESAQSIWKNDSSLAGQLKKIAIREAKRNNKNYQIHAFSSLGKFCEARDDLDMFEEVFEIIAPILEELISPDKMDTTDDTCERNGKDTESAILTAGISCLFQAVNTSQSQPSALNHLPKLIKLVRDVATSVQITLTTRGAIYERVKDLFENLATRTASSGSGHAELAWDFFALLDLSEPFGSETMRLQRAEAAEKVVLALRAGVFGGIGDAQKTNLGKMKEVTKLGKLSERSPSVRMVLEKLEKALE